VDPRAGLDDVEKTLPRLESDPSVVQAVDSRYTDYAIPAPPLWRILVTETFNDNAPECTAMQ
jgi:hypothetical protein